MGYIITWIILIIIALMIAESRKAPFGTTLLISIFIPIIGIIYAIVAKPKETSKNIRNYETPVNEKDKIEKLKDLKFLLDEGVLTKEKYNLKKAELYPTLSDSEHIKETDLRTIETSIGSFEKIENKPGEAFCLGCRKIDRMENLYFNPERDLYYHYECLKWALYN